MLGPVHAQVRRRVKVSVSDREFPALTGRSGTQRARRLRTRSTVWQPEAARTMKGMARVRSGQAPAWPLVSARSVH